VAAKVTVEGAATITFAAFWALGAQPPREVAQPIRRAGVGRSPPPWGAFLPRRKQGVAEDTAAQRRLAKGDRQRGAPHEAIWYHGYQREVIWYRGYQREAIWYRGYQR
jgi:hypothetical protein